MEVFIGTSPGGRNAFSLAAIYRPEGQIPQVVAVTTLSGAKSVAEYAMGLAGEWQHVSALGIDAPLTWPNSGTGIRACDEELRKWLPRKDARRLVRSLNVRPGAQVIQGPALALSLREEQSKGYLEDFPLYETSAAVTLHTLLPDCDGMLGAYKSTRSSSTDRQNALKGLVGALTARGLLDPVVGPQSASELHACISGLTVAGEHHPRPEFTVARLTPAPIQPVGECPALQVLPLA